VFIYLAYVERKVKRVRGLVIRSSTHLPVVFMTEGLAALPRSSQSNIAWSMVVCPSKSDRGFNLQEILACLLVMVLTRDVSQDMFFLIWRYLLGSSVTAARRKDYNKETMDMEYVSGSLFPRRVLC
jgi:hypothetical protein